MIDWVGRYGKRPENPIVDQNCEDLRSNQPLFLVLSRFRYLPPKKVDGTNVHIQMWTIETEVPYSVQNI